jgi:hypothetical protein
LTPEQILSASKSVLVIDWPSRDVPNALTLAGFAVVVRGGPGEAEYSAYETSNEARQAHGLAKSAGLEFLTQPYIGDAVREFSMPR